jgi:hypothetical protein
VVTTIDPAQPELPSYLLTSEKNTTTSCPAREKQADTKISTALDLVVEIGPEKKAHRNSAYITIVFVHFTRRPEGRRSLKASWTRKCSLLPPPYAI